MLAFEKRAGETPALGKASIPDYLGIRVPTYSQPMSMCVFNRTPGKSGSKPPDSTEPCRCHSGVRPLTASFTRRPESCSLLGVNVERWKEQGTAAREWRS